MVLNALSGFAVFTNNIGDALQTWADMGIFAYVLPALLIFALIYGILNATKMFGDNKGVDVVVAITIALMALQFDFVPTFFATIFPYAGVGISILLVFLILTGLFVNVNQKGWFIAYFVVASVITLIVVLSALASYDWWGGNWWEEYWATIVVLLVIGGLIAVVIASSSKTNRGGGGNSSSGGPLGFWRA